MKLFIFTFLFSTLVQVVSAQSANVSARGNIMECKNAQDKEICIGLILNRKIQRLTRLVQARRGGGGGGQHSEPISISYYDESNCTDLWGTAILFKPTDPASLEDAKAACQELADSMVNINDGNTYAEGVKIGDTCKSVSVQRTRPEQVKSDCLSQLLSQ